MSKMRSDSKWNELTAEQRDTLEGWLFEENLGYREALERVEKEFGLAASMASLGRFYQQMAKERAQADLLGVKATSDAVEKMPVDSKQLGITAMTLVTKRLIQLAVEKPDKVKELGSLARVLMLNEANEIKRGWLQLEEDRRIDELEEERSQQLIREASGEKIRAYWQSISATAKGAATNEPPEENPGNETSERNDPPS